MELIFLLTGLAVGATSAGIIVHLVYKSKYPGGPSAFIVLTQEVAELTLKHGVSEEKVSQLQRDNEHLTNDLGSERREIQQLTIQVSAKTQELIGLKEKLETQKGEITSMHEKLQAQFKNLANEILEDKSRRFTDQNKVNLAEILNPLKEKIGDFEKKVEAVNKENIDRNSALREQIAGLKEMNIQITKEAENLTKALKGETKTQGNWGEFILETILEKSGLVKGEQYELQVSVTSSDGKRQQPDVVVKLPEKKNIIIDSKVSLVAYEKFARAENEAEKAMELKSHLTSIRTHLKSLSEKNYQALYQIRSLDFVLLFMPIEPAFGLAVQNDPDLFTDAYDKNIVIVSPSTLIATLRTIASIWRQENQNRNAQEIARQGGMLYDKFVGFTEDLIKLGINLKQSRETYEQAMGKLTDGKDNLIRKTERLKELGAKTSKTMDPQLLDRSLDE